jgi:hypothetical protein
MANRWTDDEKEALYLVAQNYHEEINQYQTVEPTSGIIQTIHRAANSSRDTKAILYKLEEMGFIRKGSNSYQDNIFFVNHLKQSDFLDFSVSPSYKSLTPSKSIEFKNCFQQTALKINDIDELCSAIALSLSLSALRVKKELFDLELIRLNILMRYELVLPLIDQEKDQNLKNKELSSEHKECINTLRSEISYIYDTHSKLNPSITYSSDGTGTGKSYSVIDRFIQQTDVNNIEHGHRNLLFLTPQKAQIDIDSNLVEIAKSKGIKILCFLAQADMSNIEFKNWVTKDVSKTLFERWIKALKEEDNILSGCMYKLDNTVREAKYLNDQISMAHDNSDYESEEEYESRQKYNNYKLIDALTDLAEAILQEQKSGKYIPIKARFDKENTSKKAKILAEIIDFVLPFERAKLSPCILLATSDKFDCNVNTVVKSKDEKPIIKSLPFDYIIGQKKQVDSSDEGNKTADANGKPFAEQVDFLKDNYFLTDEENYFRKNNISFTLIVDEEHIAYNKFFNNSKTTLIEPNTKIAHVFSVVNRIVESFKSANQENKDDFVLYDANEKFVSELRRLFMTQCDISNDITLDEILRLFSNNLYHIVIDNSELEQIIHICKNVFSITPKRYFNEMGLKKIRIRSNENNTECQIYFNRDKADTNPTLHDILQVLMCVFSACSHIKDEEFKSMIREGEDNSQNSLLYKFINNAIRNRVSVDALFNRVDDENLYIDEFFTYFTPKIVFSIEKVKDLTFKSEELKNKVYVTFQLDLFEALPEVTLMRVLHNTQNAVICLSATSGFKDSFNGNYCRPVMERYGCDVKNNLDYRSISRTEGDAKNLQQLREVRAKARNISINEFFDTDENKITTLRNNSEFSACYEKWLNKLSPYVKKNDFYSNKEFKRQIEAMLLAAFDKKNSLILSLRNDFGLTMSGYAKSKTGIEDKQLKIIDKEKYRIIEIKPFDNGIILRVILFNAQMVKDLNIEEHLELKNEQTKIAFISSYKSAGTGLNLFTRYTYKDEGVNKKFDEDFERLVLINSPHYSDISNKEDGLNSIKNYVLLLKHYADKKVDIQLKDFGVNLVEGENYNILMQEHNMSILKDIMQAVGRVERRDTLLNTEIFLPSDVIDDLAIQFSRLKKDKGNELIFQSMSLLNYQLMEYCLDKVVKESFESEKKRDEFSAKMASDWEEIDSFLDNYLNRRLNDARKGNKSAVKLNEALRHIDCIENPQRYIANLLKIDEIKDDEDFYYAISNFYLNLDDFKKIRFCTKENNKKILTDLTDGDRVYKPADAICPQYHKAVKNDGSAKNILKAIFNLNFEDKLFKDMLPHPVMLPLLKGNVGEYMFKQCLKEIHIKPLEVDEIFEELESTVYELFDFYVLSEDKLFCIDVKNWSPSDKEDLSLNTKDKALRKRLQLMQIADKKNLNVTFIYVNTHHDKNAINTKQEFYDNGNIYFMNLFKVTDKYKAVDKPNSKKKSRLEERLDINTSLIQLLGGNLNG